MRLGTERIYNPTRGMDVAYNVMTDLRERKPLSHNYWPVYIQIGVGYRKGVYEGRMVRREFEYVLDTFHSLGLPLSNVIGLDANQDALDSWEGSGATTHCGDWNNENILYQLLGLANQNKPKGRGLYKMVYIDTWGDRGCIPLMDSVQQVLNPHRLYNFFTTRNAFDTESIKTTVRDVLPRYSFKDTGEALAKESGILTYGRGGAMACLKRFV